MKRFAFVFPGQGSQSVGMGLYLLQAFPEKKAVYEEASQILGYDLLEIIQNGPDERLRETHIAQPSLFVTSVVISQVLAQLDIQPSIVAGHSVGEYAALVAAKVLRFPEALSLIKERARLMQEAATQRPGGMVAVLGLAKETLETICQDVRTSSGVCVPVNYNSAEQTVVAGEKSAMTVFAEKASQAGAKRVIPLNVSGAFHSPLMGEAAEKMRPFISNLVFQAPVIPVIMNVDGQAYEDASTIQLKLQSQLASAVQWVETFSTIQKRSLNGVVEVGSGRVLAGLAKRFNKEWKIFTTDSYESLEEIKKAAHSEEGVVS